MKLANFSTRFWRWFLRSPDIKRVVRVKSLVPHWDTHCGAVGWPVLLVVRSDGIRETTVPIWDTDRLAFWRKAA